MEQKPDGMSLLNAIFESSHDAIIGTDRNGTIISWNPAAERLYGWTADEAIGRPVGKIFPDERDEEIFLSRLLAGEQIQEMDGMRRRRDGSLAAVAVNAFPVANGSNEIAGTIRIHTDISAVMRWERATRHLAAIVESSEDAIASKDLDGIVKSWNTAAERMFGYTAEEIIGKSIRLVIPADRQSEEDEVLARLRRGDKIDHFETIRRRKDGTEFPVSLTVSPIRDGTGKVVGASKIARDISDRRAAEAERLRLQRAAEENSTITEMLNAVGAAVASELDRSRIVQAVIDAATRGTGAEVGAFSYNAVTPETGETHLFHSLAGGPAANREAFSKLRTTGLFDATFRGEAVIRLDDLTRDPRFDAPAQESGTVMPLRSYLAVPVKSAAGNVLGGLFFAHSQRGRFSDAHERLVTGIAAWASVALENARLYLGVREASRLKDEFLATLSHELRTPLNAILGYARMLNSGIVTPDRRERAVETIERNATALTQIVEDVLDVSRIVAGKMRLTVEPVDLPDVVRHAIDAVLPAAEAKGIHITRALDSSAGPIAGDADRLQQVIWNLMSNAVKFTPTGGTVDVRVTRSNAHAEIVVADTGMGIPRSFLPYIFERFRQADSSTTREWGGLGLGLGIARQLVEMHGGTITAHSAGNGLGASFKVELPLMHAEGRADEHPPSNGRRTLADIPNLSGVRVLAVDDDPDALALIQEALEATGAEVYLASSAAEALERLAVAEPDVLVTDLAMPRMDGFELLARIRESDSKYASIPAAALTAYARSEDRGRALRSGFQLHLSKPIDPRELMAAIASLAHRTPAER